IRASWGYEPLLSSFWPEVRRQAVLSKGALGEAFAAARRQVERGWGCHNMEVPLSVVCQQPSFAHFAGLLLAEPARFVDVYNTALGEHRRRHGIRSHHHPVPDLARDGDWLELPLWGWRAGQRRGRLFARVPGRDRVELRVDTTKNNGPGWPGLPSPASSDFVP